MDESLDIVILGGGTAGWTAAAVLASLVPRGRASVRLVESEEIGIVGVGEATLPHIRTLNRLLGIDEAEMIRATRATFKLGIRFVDWGYKGSCYTHPFGTHGGPRSGPSFFQRWLRARRDGLDASLEEYSYAIVAATENRFDFPDAAKTSVRSTYDYAYHFDASLYAALLRRLAESRGAVRTEGKVRDIQQDAQSGDIRALVLESGEIVRGDFFMDCSGFRSLLLGKTLDVPWDDWSKWLPCDRALAAPTSRADDFPPYTRSTAMEAGWQWRIPLQHRTGNGYVFSSAFTDEDRASQAFMENLDSPVLAEPRLLRFQAGRRARCWERNCVALGLASGFLEPLESTSIYLIQVAAMTLLPLLPGRQHDQRLVDEFNRRIDLEYDRVRDFLILHYHLNSRDDAEIWRYCRNMDVPDSLRGRMELFRHSGYVESYKDGLFNPPSWLSVFLGQGLLPEHYHAGADDVPIDLLRSEFDRLGGEIQDGVANMPHHAAVVARYAGAQPASDSARQAQATT